MLVFEKVSEIQQFISEKRQSQSVGFVPTMGALHEGHLSLIRKCKAENDIVVVSIFVNPTQFNDKNDLKNYPRMLNKDLQLLETEKVDIVFVPSEKEIYPEPDNRIFDLEGLDSVMEGAFRPGHFNGVVQVVTRLFEIVQPHKAYFGEKDFQQLTIIKYIVKKFNTPVEIIPCPIVREPDGLAMSSRNLLLGSNERAAAPLIYQTLKKAVELKEKFDVESLKKWVYDQINSNPFLAIEYFEIVDDKNLQPIKSWDEKNNKVGCIAVRAGNIRLIDNIRF